MECTSRGLFIECLGLGFVALLIVGVIITDTGTNKVSLKGYRIIKELPDVPNTRIADNMKAKTTENAGEKAVKIIDEE